jgi:hypothetical protein
VPAALRGDRPLINNLLDYVTFFLIVSAFFLISYFVPNGIAYWLCWKRNNDDWASHRIQKDREPNPGQVSRIGRTIDGTCSGFAVG